jgi:hypothetical protein
MLVLLLIFGSGAAALALRSNLGRVVLTWDRFLTPLGDRALTALAERLAADDEVVRMTYQHARGLTRERGLMVVLDAGHGLLVQFGRERERLLEGMRKYSLDATQIESLPALWPLRFHLPGLALHAGLYAIADLFLVGSPERFRLRLSFLRKAVRHVLKATRRVALEKAGSGTLDAALHDWDTVNRETVASFRAVATAILNPPLTDAVVTRNR